jgi:hypothetical protein
MILCALGLRRYRAPFARSRPSWIWTAPRKNAPGRPWRDARSGAAHERERHLETFPARISHVGPCRRWNIALGKPHRPAEFPRRDIDQHQVHRLLSPRGRTIPARQHKFLAREIAHPRALNRYLEADLALGSPQRCPRRPSLRTWRAPQASSASSLHIAPSGSTPIARQNRSKLTDNWSHALPTARYPPEPKRSMSC